MRNGQEKVLVLARRKGILRVKDLHAAGIHPEYLRRLCEKGSLVRIDRGLYMPADAQPSANISLATSGVSGSPATVSVQFPFALLWSQLVPGQVIPLRASAQMMVY